MGDYDLKTTTGPSTSGPTTTPTSTTGDSAQDTVGNQAIQDQLKADGGASPGRLTYRDALGDMVGDKLYDQLEKQLSDDKLVKHANKAVSSAMGKLETYFKDNSAPSDHEAASLLVKALDAEIKGIAKRAVVDSGFSEGVRDFVDDSPYLIASAAVAGAVAYVLSNQDLPLIESKLGLGGGHALLAGVDIGRTLDLTLEQVRLGYRYQGDKIKGSIIGDYFQDGTWQVETEYTQTLNPQEQIKLQGLYAGGGENERTRLDLSYRNPNVAAAAYWERNRGTEELDTYGGSISTVAKNPDDLNAYLRGEYRTDGSWESAGGVSKNEGNWDWGVEGYAGQDATGKSDSGVRAMLNFRF